MHETSIMNDLMRRISDIARDEGARRVVRVRVELGALSNMSAQHFREHFVIAAKNTAASDAQLEVEMAETIDARHAQAVRLVEIEVEE